MKANRKSREHLAAGVNGLWRLGDVKPKIQVQGPEQWSRNMKALKDAGFEVAVVFSEERPGVFEFLNLRSPAGYGIIVPWSQVEWQTSLLYGKDPQHVKTLEGIRNNIHLHFALEELQRAGLAWSMSRVHDWNQLKALATEKRDENQLKLNV